jgi:4-hydroxy-tetrahydrodipicolinate synthase
LSRERRAREAKGPEEDEMLRGVLTALVTPFRDGDLDEEAYRRLVAEQVSAGIQGVVVCGSTGEASCLTLEERRRLVELARSVCQGSPTRVWVGTGTNSTRTTLELTRDAEAQGADGAMIVAPYYNKPTQEGLFQHFERVARETRIPLIAYNVPGRTAVNMTPETAARLHATGRYAAIKEASGSLDQVSDIRARCDLTVLSGDDSLTLPMMALGAQGVVSVVSNLLPRETLRLVEAFLAGELDEARRWHFRLLPFFRAAFLETNPAPIKMLLHLEGKMSAETRLPLVPASEAVSLRLAEVLQHAGWRREPV